MQTLLGEKFLKGRLNAVVDNLVAMTAENREQRRLKALSEYQVLGDALNPRLDRVVQVVKTAFRIDVVSIVLLPELGIARLASAGLPKPSPIPRSQSFSQMCIENEGPLTFLDMSKDERLANHPLVVEPPYIKTALGAPLRSHDGWWLGSLNIWSAAPRTFSAAEISMLEDFAHIVSDELELHRTLATSLNHETLLQAIFDNASVGIVVNRPNGNRVFANSRYCEMLGYTKEELFATQVTSVSHPDDFAATRDLMLKAGLGKGENYTRESRLVSKAGETKWFRFTGSCMSGPNGGEPYLLSIVENIDDRRKAEKARALLLGEINHRVKNTLAIVQGVAKQLLRTTDSTAEFSEAFEARIQALARSHDMLTQSSWNPLPIDRIVKQLVCDTWQPYERQIEFVGPDISLNAQTTVMLTLLLNELMTNAVKHGALKTDKGVIRISGQTRQVGDLPWLDLKWCETTEHRVALPERRGLGTYLLERAPKLGLSGTGRLEFTPQGIRCELSFPVFPDSGLFQLGLEN